MDKATSVRQKPAANPVKNQSNESRDTSAKGSQKHSPAGDNKSKPRNLKLASGGRVAERSRETSSAASKEKATAPAHANDSGKGNSARENDGPPKASANMVLFGSAATANVGPSVASGLSSTVGPIENMSATFTNAVSGATQSLRNLFGATEERKVEDSDVDNNLEATSDSTSSISQPQPAPPSEGLTSTSEVTDLATKPKPKSTDTFVNGKPVNLTIEGQPIDEHIHNLIGLHGVKMPPFQTEQYLKDMVANENIYDKVTVTNEESTGKSESTGTKRVPISKGHLEIDSTHSRNHLGRIASKIVASAYQDDQLKATFEIGINHDTNKGSFIASSHGKSREMQFLPNYSVVPGEISKDFSQQPVVGEGNYETMDNVDDYTPKYKNNNRTVELTKNHGEFNDTVIFEGKGVIRGFPGFIEKRTRVQTNRNTGARDTIEYNSSTKEYELLNHRPLDFSTEPSQPSSDLDTANPFVGNAKLNHLIQNNPELLDLPENINTTENQTLVDFAENAWPPATTSGLPENAAKYSSERASDGTRTYSYSDKSGGTISSQADMNRQPITTMMMTKNAANTYIRAYDYGSSDPSLVTVTSNVLPRESPIPEELYPPTSDPKYIEFLEMLQASPFESTKLGDNESKMSVNPGYIDITHYAPSKNGSTVIEHRYLARSIGPDGLRVDLIATHRPPPPLSVVAPESTGLAVAGEQDLTGYLGNKIRKGVSDIMKQARNLPKKAHNLGSNDERDWQ